MFLPYPHMVFWFFEQYKLLRDLLYMLLVVILTYISTPDTWNKKYVLPMGFLMLRKHPPWVDIGGAEPP